MAGLRQPVWLKPEEVPALPESWRALSTEEACIQLKPGKLFDSKTVSESGRIPVLNQSETGLLGYHDEECGVVATPVSPVVTFANHTCAMRLMKESFSTIQNIFPKVGKPGVTDTVYFYYASLGRIGLSDYKGHHPLFRQTLIPVPPLPVQRRIASILSAYDELIENNQRRIQILETMARALYREWFVEFRFPGYENVTRVASSLGDIPEGWKVNPLESLMADYIGGGWGKETGDDKHTKPAWVIRGTDIPDARNCQVAGVPYRFHAGSNIRSRRLLAGDILFEVSGGSKGQPVGRTLLVTPQLLSAFGDDPIICASFCKRIRPDAAGYSSELLYLSFVEGYTSGEIEQFQVQSTGISNFKWTEYIGKTERAIPPEPLRVSFRELVAPLFSQIGTLGLTIQNLRRTRDLLLPRLLSGQVTLADAAA